MDERAIIGIILGIVYIVMKFVFLDYHRLYPYAQTRAGIKAYATYTIMVMLSITLTIFLYPFLLPY